MNNHESTPKYTFSSARPSVPAAAELSSSAPDDLDSTFSSDDSCCWSSGTVTSARRRNTLTPVSLSTTTVTPARSLITPTQSADTSSQRADVSNEFRTPSSIQLIPASRLPPTRSRRITPGSSSSSSRTPRSSMSRTSVSSRTPRSTTRTPASSSKTPGSSSRTPGSRSTSTPCRENNTSNVVAIVEGRGVARGEVGMSSIDLKNPCLILSQFSDSPTYVKVITKLQILNPVEIIMPSTSCENGNMTKLFQLISDHFTESNVVTVQRKYFNEQHGHQYIKQLCLPEYKTVEMEVMSKYYCMATCAALLKYVEFIQNMVYAQNSLKVVFRGSEKTTMIDAATVKHLELIQNCRDVKSEHTLCGVLNHCKTNGGLRQLRSTILQPPSDLETICLRQEVVKELTENEELFYSLQNVLSRFVDIDHLLAMCIQVPKHETLKIAEQKITNVIYLKHTLELIKPLHRALSLGNNSMFKTYSKALEDPRFELIKDKIKCVIHDDTTYQKGLLNMRKQKCFAIKPYINGLLDVARRTYTEIIDDITEMVKQLSEENELPLKLAYNSTRGFFIQLYCSGGRNVTYTRSDLPDIFIKVTKFKNSFSFTTEDLIKFNDRITESLNEIYMMTNLVVTKLFGDIRESVGCLYHLTECVAMLDMLVSLAHVCTLSDYVRPEFTDTLAVKAGRHPILDNITIHQAIPNNTYASDDGNFLIITGPNMSGKSTYLKQIALLQIMSQIGSFVPAEYASFRVTDQIFSRVGSDDEIETNSSTFMVEMRETAYIIQNATDKSLIIIDELGRGTSADEGIGICHAVCEYLISLKAFTFFATHFMELTNLDSLYPNAENYHFEIERSFNVGADCHKISYTHVLSRGKTSEKQYGIQLAEVSTLPDSVVRDAKLLSKMISRNRTDSGSDNVEDASRRKAVKQKAVFKLAMRLIQAAHSSKLDAETLILYCSSLKSQYRKDLSVTEE